MSNIIDDYAVSGVRLMEYVRNDRIRECVKCIETINAAAGILAEDSPKDADMLMRRMMSYISADYETDIMAAAGARVADRQYCREVIKATMGDVHLVDVDHNDRAYIAGGAYKAGIDAEIIGEVMAEIEHNERMIIDYCNTGYTS